MNLVDCKQDNPPDQNIEFLQKQLEFYMSDANLYHDKYLQNFLTKSKYVDLSIFLNFNKIKQLIQKDSNPNESLITAINNSELLKLSKDQKQFKRKQPIKFDDEKIQQFINERTIYVENLPDHINLEIITQIFQNVGQIAHISIPSHKFSKKTKGFSFIQFQKQESIQEAINQFNNCIPAQLMHLNNQKLQPLNIITKLEWLQCKYFQIDKQQYKDIKKEINTKIQDNKRKASNQSISIELGSNEFQDKKTEIIKNVLIQVSNIPKTVDKYALKIWAKQVCMPEYIDFHQKSQEAIFRFATPTFADDFLNNLQKIENVSLKKQLIIGEQENQYWEKIIKYQNNFREFNFKKKQKN